MYHIIIIRYTATCLSQPLLFVVPKRPEGRVVREGRRQVTTTRNQASGGGDNDLYYQIALNVLPRRLFGTTVPILFFLIVGVFYHATLKLHDRYLHPYLQTLQWTPERAALKETYPRIECQLSDLTTTTPADLLLHTSNTYSDNDDNIALSMAQQAVDKALLHGATVLPDILTLPAAFNVRAYVLRRNRQLSTHESIDVIMSDHCSSFALSAVEHESVTTVLQQVGRNQAVRDTLTALLGSDPALVELQVILARRHYSNGERCSLLAFVCAHVYMVDSTTRYRCRHGSDGRVPGHSPLFLYGSLLGIWLGFRQCIVVVARRSSWFLSGGRCGNRRLEGGTRFALH